MPLTLASARFSDKCRLPLPCTASPWDRLTTNALRSLATSYGLVCQDQLDRRALAALVEVQSQARTGNNHEVQDVMVSTSTVVYCPRLALFVAVGPCKGRCSNAGCRRRAPARADYTAGCSPTTMSCMCMVELPSVSSQTRSPVMRPAPSQARTSIC